MKQLYILFALFLGLQVPAQTLNDNLLTHYTFDGNVNDQSGNNYHATPYNISYVNDRFNFPNKAIYFNGTDGYIDLPNLPALKPQLPVSFSFWIRYDSNHHLDRELFNTSFEDDKSSGVFFNTQSSTGKFTINYGDGSANYTSATRRSFVSDKIIETNKWIYVVVIVESGTDMKIYINCENPGGQYSGTGGSLYYSPFSGSIGRHDRSMTAPANYFKGALDDFRYWDRALTEREVILLCEYNLNIDEFILDPKSIILYPNPTDGVINIISEHTTFDTIHIFDIKGNLILESNFQNSLRVNELLSPGVYILTLSNDETTITKRLIYH